MYIYTWTTIPGFGPEKNYEAKEKEKYEGQRINIISRKLTRPHNVRIRNIKIIFSIALVHREESMKLYRGF